MTKAPPPKTPSTDPRKVLPNRKKRRLLRWLVRLAVLAIVLRIGLAFALTTLVEYGLGFAGLDATCATASLSLSDGSLRLRQVTLVDPESRPGSLKIEIDEVAADFSTWQLLFGQIVLSDAVLRGVSAEVTRSKDGSLMLPASWTKSTGAEPKLETVPATGTGGPPSFALPLSIATARIHDLRLRVVSAEPMQTPMDFVLDADFDDLGRADRKGQIELRLRSEGIVDRLILSAAIETPDRGFSCEWSLLAHGLDLQHLAAGAVPGITPMHFMLRGDVSLTPAVGDPNSSLLALRVKVDESPELAESLEVWLNATFLSNQATELEGGVIAKGVILQPLRSLLQRAGVAINSAGVDVSGKARATIAADASMSLAVHDLRISHQSNALVLKAATIDRLVVSDDAIEFGSVHLDGPTADVFRLPDGSLSCCGLRLGSGAPGHAVPNGAAPAPATASPAITIAKLDCRNTQISYTDLGLANSPTLAVRDLIVTGEHLAYAAEQSGTATVSVQLPGIAQTLTAKLRLQPGRDGGAIEADVLAQGITLETLEPWLKPAGITAKLQSGRLQFGARVELATVDRVTSLSMHLADLRLTDGEKVLVSVRSADLREFLPGDERLAFGSLQIDQPFVLIERNANTTTIAGLGFAGKPARRVAMPVVTTQTAAPLAVDTGPVTLRNGSVRWLDNEQKAEAVTIGFDIELGAMAGSGQAAWTQPVPFAIAVHLQQQLETLSLRGVGSRNGERITISGHLLGSGIRGTVLDPFLPAHIRSPLTDGRLEADLSATLVQGSDSIGLDCTIHDLQLSDHGTELAAIDHLELKAPALGAELVHVQKLRIEGLRGIVTSTPDGLQVPGLLLTTVPVTKGPKISAGGTIPSPTKQQVTLPQLRLDEVLIKSDGLVWHDRRNANREPLTTSFRLELIEPWATAAELDSSPAIRWQWNAKVAPLCDTVSVTAAISPFDLEPEFDVHFEATGINTAAIAAISPALAESVVGTEKAAALRFDLHAQLDLRRSNLTHFDLRRPFGATVLLEDLELQSDNGDSLVRIPLLDVELRAFDPSRGDVLLRSVELESPRIKVTRTELGLAIAGFLLREPEPLDPPAAALPSAPLPTASHGPEFAIDELTVYGLSLDYTDATTKPVTRLPIEALDLALQRWSNRCTSEPRPFAFQANLRGEMMPFEKRVVSSSILADIAGAATDLVAGAADEHEIELRPLVDEIVCDGHLQLFPKLTGHVEASVHRVELVAFRGLARLGSVDIADGVLDATVSVNLTNQGTDIKSQQTFTWLQVSELAGGPISTYLKLPGTLDAVLFTLRNDNYEQSIPFQLHIPAEGLPDGRLRDASVEALTLLIGEAVASAPVRIARVLTDAIGLTGGEDRLVAPIVLPCEAGSAQPSTINLPALLQPVSGDASVVFVLTHELSQADYDRVAILANPDLELARLSVAHLTKVQKATAAQRRDLAADVTARLLAGQVHEVLPKFEQLRTTDRTLGEIQEALDAALSLFDGDTPRHKKRRTRAATLELADLRLTAVSAELTKCLGPGSEARIELRPARAIITQELSAGGHVVITPHRKVR